LARAVPISGMSAFQWGGRIRGLMTQLVTAGFVQRPVIVGQQEQRSFVEVFPSPALVTLFPGQNRRGHIHCRALRYKYKKGRAWAEVHSEWEIYRARLRFARMPRTGAEIVA